MTEALQAAPSPLSPHPAAGATAGDYVLRPYQTRALEFLGRPGSNGGALLIEVGMGKTAILAHHAVRGGFSRTLYVGPKRVAASVPSAEVPRWAELRQAGLEVVVVEGDERARINALSRRGNHPMIFTLGFHQLHWLVDAINAGRLKIPRFRLLVLDESTKIKNPNTKTFRAAFALAKYADQVVTASGTAAVQGLEGLWAQVSVIDKGAALGKSYSAFLRRYFIQDGYRMTPAPGSEKAILKAVEPVAFALRGEDWLDLPSLIRRDIVVQVSADVRASIERAAAGADFAVDFDDADGTPTRAHFKATDIPARAAMRAWQLTQGFIKGGESEWFPVHDEKLDALSDLVEELAGEPLLVAHHFQFDRHRIVARLAQDGVDGVEVFDAKNAADLAEQIGRWQRGEIRVLLIHPQSGGHGVDGLQKGGHHLCWYGQMWSAEGALQLEARLHRSGQTKPVLVHHIVVEDSLDEAIRAAIRTGAKGNEALMVALAWRDATARARPGATEQEVEASMQERLAELRRQMQRLHPDRSGADTAEDFIRVRRQYEKLKAEMADEA